MGYPSDFDEPLPDIYRSREAFFASLPAWSASWPCSMPS